MALVAGNQSALTQWRYGYWRRDTYSACILFSWLHYGLFNPKGVLIMGTVTMLILLMGCNRIRKYFVDRRSLGSVGKTGCLKRVRVLFLGLIQVSATNGDRAGNLAADKRHSFSYH